MKIDHKLLEKYHLGLCTTEEEAAIMAWLDSNNSDEELDWPVEHKQAIGQGMWENIAEHIDSSPEVTPFFSRKLYRRITRYAAAACLVLGVIYGERILCDLGYNRTEMSYDNSRNTGLRQVRTAGIAVTLLPESRLKLATNLCRTKSEVVFCGSALLENRREHEVRLAVLASCNDSPIPAKSFVLKPETKYAVFQHEFREKETYVVNDNEIHHLPPVLQYKAEQILKI